MSPLELIKIEGQYKHDLAVFNIEEEKFERKVVLSFRRFIKEIINNELIKDMLAQAKKYRKNLNNLIHQCNEKTQFAQLNIQISSLEVRDALRSILNFGNNI